MDGPQQYLVHIQSEKLCCFFLQHQPKNKKRKQSGTKFLNRNSWKLCYLLCKKNPWMVFSNILVKTDWEIVFYFFWTKKKKTECYYFTAATFNVYVQVSKNIMSPFTFTARRLIVSWHVLSYISQVKSKFYKKRGATFFYDVTRKLGPLDFTQYRSKSSSF